MPEHNLNSSTYPGAADANATAIALDTKVTGGDGITDLVKITQDAYDLLSPPDADTAYFIVN